MLRLVRALWRSVLAGALLLGSPIGGLAAEGLDDATVRHLAALRDRGLYRLAVSYCEHRLEPENLALEERADLTLELSRTLLDQAGSLPASERDALWTRSARLPIELLDALPDSPRRVLLQIQAALVQTEVGSAARWRLAVAPWDAAARHRGTTALTAARDQLRQIESGLTARRKGAPGHPAARQRTLLFQVRRMLGQTQVDLAEVHPPQSADRAATLLEAQRTLKTLADSQDEDEVGWEARVAVLRATRLQGDLTLARRQIELLKKRNPPASFARRITWEELRCCLAEPDLAAARPLAASLTGAGDAPDSGAISGAGEESLLVADWLAAVWRAQHAADPRADRKAFQAFEAFVDRQVPRQSTEWRERLLTLRDAVREERVLGPELAALTVQAQEAFHAGDLSDAERLYGAAARKAQTSGLKDRAFALGLQRCHIALQREDWEAAAADLEELATAFPRHPRAGEAHLLAAYARGRSWQADRTDAKQTLYRQSLEAHLATYSDSPTQGEASWMLAELLAFNRQWSGALAQYAKIPPDHARAAAARSAAARLCDPSAGGSPITEEDRRELQRDAPDILKQLLPEDAASLDASECDVALALAAVLLRQPAPNHTEAEQWLTRVDRSLEARLEESASPATEGTPVPSENQRLRLSQLRVQSLAVQHRFAEAQRLLEDVARSSPADLLTLLEGIASLSADEAHDPLHGLATLQLQAARSLDRRRRELTPAQERRLDLALARALRAGAQSAQAQEVYARLVAASPRDAAVLAEQGEFLLSRPDRDSQQAGLLALRRCESLSKPGSVPWLTARLQTARALATLGQTAEALKLLRKTRLLYPTLGGEDLARQYRELEARCSEPAGS